MTDAEAGTKFAAMVDAIVMNVPSWMPTDSACKQCYVFGAAKAALMIYMSTKGQDLETTRAVIRNVTAMIANAPFPSLLNMTAGATDTLASSCLFGGRDSDAE